MKVNSRAAQMLVLARLFSDRNGLNVLLPFFLLGVVSVGSCPPVKDRIHRHWLVCISSIPFYLLPTSLFLN
jgi:hypothetical protein